MEFRSSLRKVRSSDQCFSTRRWPLTNHSPKIFWPSYKEPNLNKNPLSKWVKLNFRNPFPSLSNRVFNWEMVGLTSNKKSYQSILPNSSHLSRILLYDVTLNISWGRWQWWFHEYEMLTWAFLLCEKFCPSRVLGCLLTRNGQISLKRSNIVSLCHIHNICQRSFIYHVYLGV